MFDCCKIAGGYTVHFSFTVFENLVNLVYSSLMDDCAATVISRQLCFTCDITSEGCKKDDTCPVVSSSHEHSPDSSLDACHQSAIASRVHSIECFCTSHQLATVLPYDYEYASRFDEHQLQSLASEEFCAISSPIESSIYLGNHHLDYSHC